jgi:transposase
MRSVDEILAQARRLSVEERRKLVETLEEGLADEQPTAAEAARLAALDRWIERAGTGHSDFTEVARDKYKQIAR